MEVIMARVALVLVALSLLALPEWATGQAPAASGPEEIVVHGQRNPEQVRQFVHNISIAAPSVGQLARWNQHICPGVVGATQETSQLIIDQIARRASALGLHVGAPGCRPDLTIIVTSDSDRVAQAVYDQRRTLLTRPNNVDGATLGEQALAEFVHTPRPVRWWHVSQKTTADGYIMNDERSSPTSNSALTAIQTAANPTSPTSGDGMSNTVAHRADGTRLRRETRQDFNYVLVIVDTSRLNAAPLSAVADYIAFVSLTQVNPDMSVAGFPSILNLFNMAAEAASRPAALTDWDLDYLDGLYRATRNARSASQQQGEIARRMVVPRS
jgi:hypothetical protein